MKPGLKMKMEVKSGDIEVDVGLAVGVGSGEAVRVDVMACMWHVGRMLRTPPRSRLRPVNSTGKFHRNVH